MAHTTGIGREEKWQSRYDKKIDEYYEESDTKYIVIYVDVPQVQPTIFSFSVDKSPPQVFGRNEAYLPKISAHPIPAIDDPRPLTKSNANLILDMLREELEDEEKSQGIKKHRHFFIATWRWYLNNYKN